MLVFDVDTRVDGGYTVRFIAGDGDHGEATLDAAGRLDTVVPPWRFGSKQAQRDVEAARKDPRHPLNRPPHINIGAANPTRFGQTPPALLEGLAAVRAERPARGSLRIAHVATHERGWKVTYEVRADDRARTRTQTRVAHVGFNGQRFDPGNLDD